MENHHHPHGKKEMQAYLPVYLKAWGLTFVIAGLQLAGSIVSGSFALLADVTHVFTDTLVGLGPVSVEFFRHRLRVPARRIEQAGGLFVSGVLLFVGYRVIGESLEGLSGGHEHDVEGGLMFVFTVIAAGVNYLQHRLLRRVSPMHRHAAHAGFHFHILTDLVKNLLLPVIALTIFFGGPESLDIWAALGIGVLIFLRAFILGAESILGERVLQRALDRFIHWIAR